MDRIVPCLTANSYVEVLSLNTSECDYFGVRAFKEITKIK